MRAFWRIWDCLQISLLILSELKQMNFFSPRNHQKTYDFWRSRGEEKSINSLKFAYYWKLNWETISNDLWRSYGAEFSHMLGLHEETRNCMVFHFRSWPAKSNDKILWKLNKTTFWGLYGHFRANKNFSVTFFSFYISIVVQKFRKN